MLFLIYVSVFNVSFHHPIYFEILVEIDRILDFKLIRYSTDIYSEFTVTFIMCLEISDANQHHPYSSI